MDLHLKTHVFIKIRIPVPPLANPRSNSIQLMYTGMNGYWEDLGIDSNLKGITQCKIYTIKNLSIYYNIIIYYLDDDAELNGFWNEFMSLSTFGEAGITKETFERCLGPVGLEKNLINERMFDFYDQDGDGIISFSEFVVGIGILTKGSLSQRTKCNPKYQIK